MANLIDRIISPREAAVVAEIMAEFSEMQTWRSTQASQWEEISELILPNYRNTFYYGNFNWPGQKKTARQIDASGMLALHRFGAILDSLLTPRNMTWHQLASDNDYVMKDRATRLWFEKATRALFKYRYAPHANFASQNQQNYQVLGAFGTGSLLCDRYLGVNGEVGLRYKALPPGEMFIRENHQGEVDSFIRWYRLTARQALQVPGWAEKLPKSIHEAAEKSKETQFDFLHRVAPNKEYDKGRLDWHGKLYSSQYMSIDGKCLLQEGGYHTFPTAISRYEQAPGEVYGRSPASMVLPALKTLNAQKATFLKQGHRAADPILLTTDDGIVDFQQRPGALNKGGMNAQGKRLIDILPTGEIQTSKEMMDEERSLINDAFLVSLFQILTETPTMTATEVVERTSEKGILLAPTVGRQQSEYLGPLIDRELDLLQQMGVLDPMPPRLREAKGEYHVVYTSPLSRAAKAQEVAGFSRTLDILNPVIQTTQDPSLLDAFDMDVVVPEVAKIQSVPESWMASPEKVAAKKQARAKQQQQEQQIQAAPAAAAMMKAQQPQGAPTAAPQQGQ